MFRRLTAAAPQLLAVRFSSTEATAEVAASTKKFETVNTVTSTVVTADPVSKKGDDNALLNEYRKRAEDPMGLPKTKATVKTSIPDNFIYNRGYNEVPLPDEQSSRSTAEKFARGQIRTTGSLYMVERTEQTQATKVAIATRRTSARYDNFFNKSVQGTAEFVDCKPINPLEHDLTYYGCKDFRYGVTRKQVRGGTYLRV